MKNLVKYVALVFVAFGMASCVQDLDTKPIDPNSSTSFNADRMFTKCYACMAVIGQSGPGSDSDVEDIIFLLKIKCLLQWEIIKILIK